MTALPPPPAGQVYVHCEAGSGVREGYLLVPESISGSNTLSTATDPVTKESVWQIVPPGMDAVRGRHLGQPYYPVTEKTTRKLDIVALKQATEMPATVIPLPAPAPVPVVVSPAAPVARTALAAGVAAKSCGADGDGVAWMFFVLCLVWLVLALWVVPRLIGRSLESKEKETKCHES